jgi:hypothetical protein
MVNCCTRTGSACALPVCAILYSVWLLKDVTLSHLQEYSSVCATTRRRLSVARTAASRRMGLARQLRHAFPGIARQLTETTVNGMSYALPLQFRPSCKAKQARAMALCTFWRG